jgi:hypothetical protein
LLRNSCVGACREDDIDLKVNEFSCDLGDAFGAGVRPRYSIRMVRPSIQPSSRSRCTKTSIHGRHMAALLPNTPTVGSFGGCCARAASGQAAAPPRSAMKSRRLIWRKPTKGQRCASQQNCPAYVACGSTLPVLRAWLAERLGLHSLGRRTTLQPHTVRITAAWSAPCRMRSASWTTHGDSRAPSGSGRALSRGYSLHRRPARLHRYAK